MEAFLEKFEHLKHFNLEEIKSITGDFDSSRVIGEGGFGKVYQGVLSDSKGEYMVAFKRLSSNCGQGNPEFLKEIFMLSRYKHENLISLLGFCDEVGEKILAYEHASNGSLDRHLSSPTLTWTQRLKICVGAAKALCYLHDPKETHQRVIHRDIKSSNILLDGNWNAKLSDMGLSKIGPAANQEYSFIATSVVGTYFYIDPRYMETSILTKESDVYSFGVVLFEVMCGSLCFVKKDGRFQSLLPRWKKSYKENKVDEIIFHDLKQDMDMGSLKTFSDIAYQCLKKSREDRPMMSLVVEKLEIALRLQPEILDNRKEFIEKVMAASNIEEIKMLLLNGCIIGGKTVLHEVLHEQLLKDEEVDLQTDAYWEQKLPTDYEDMIKWSKDSLQWTTKKELYSIFCKGFLIKYGYQWFSLAKTGKKCHMLSAEQALGMYHSDWETKSLPESRFGKVAFDPDEPPFYIYCKSKILSPQTAYGTYLVYKLQENHSWFEAPVKCKKFGVSEVWHIYLLSPKAPDITTGKIYPNKALPQQRNDGWMEVQLYEFQTDAESTPINFKLYLFDFESLRGLIMEGIEFKPI